MVSAAVEAVGELLGSCAHKLPEQHGISLHDGGTDPDGQR